MVGTIKKENSPTDVDSHSQINSDDRSNRNENSDPKPSSKSRSNKKGRSKGKTCCCCRCCRGQHSDDESRASNEDSKQTIPKTVASPAPNKTESDLDKKIMMLEPVPSTSPHGSLADSAESSNPKPYKCRYKPPTEIQDLDTDPSVVKADKDTEVPEIEVKPKKKEEMKTIPDPAVEENQTIPDPEVVQFFHRKDELDSDEASVVINAVFRTDKLSVEGNDKKELQLLEARKNSQEGMSDCNEFDENRPPEHLQLPGRRSKSDSSHTMSEESKEKKKELKDSGSDPKKPSCVGKVISWLRKKKP